MLTAIEIENFKGIGAPVRIELRPVTLLFGPNNAGKSTILHALQYLHELLVSGRADVDRTTLGGGTVDLGGFDAFVHGHRRDRPVRLRAKLDVGNRNIAVREVGLSSFDVLSLDIDDELEAVWVEVEVSHGLLRKVSFGINDEDAALATIELDARGRQPSLLLNGAHPVIRRDEEGIPVLHAAMDEAPNVQGNGDQWLVPMSPYASALPDWDANLFDWLSEDWQQKHAPLIRTLNRLIVGGLSEMRAALSEAIYVGPLRAIPPRGARPQKTQDRGRWAEGMAAWDALAQPGNLAAASAWLERLAIGVTLEAVMRVEFGAETLRPLISIRNSLAHGQKVDATELSFAIEQITEAQGTPIVKLRDPSRNALLDPADLGVGVAQVVPVVVAATMGDRRAHADPSRADEWPPSIVMLEQPELHCHPAVQVGLGDLFAHASSSRQLIIETHSEHLLLRLLRRIEETRAETLPEGAPELTPEDVSVIFVEEGQGQTSVQRLRVDASGEFIDPWPRGFFEERRQELF